jgi:serine phosphatase RsbU (regulator of sigma subunit)
VIRTIVFLFLLLFSFYPTLEAQDRSKADTLEKQIKLAKEDTLKVNLLNDVTWQYLKSNTDKAQQYGEQALALAKKLKFGKGEARSHLNLGNLHYVLGDYKTSLDHYLAAEHYYTSVNDKKGIANCLLAVGNIYYAQQNFDEALKYQLRSLKIREEMGDKAGISGNYTNLGNIYFERKEFDKALDYHQRSIVLKEELGDKKGLSSSYGNIGNIYYELGKYNLALDYTLKATGIRYALGNKSGLAQSYVSLGQIYDKMGKTDKAIQSYKDAIATAEEINFKDGVKSGYQALAAAYEQKKDIPKAYEAYKRYSQLKDSLMNESTSKQLTEVNAKFESEKKEKEIALLTKNKEIDRLELQRREDKLKKQQIIVVFVIVALLGILLFSYVLYNRYQLKKKANYKLEEAYSQIEERNKDITDSIKYAKRIQEAIFPGFENLKEVFSDSFVLYRPKAIVSGDFFWLHKYGDNYLLAVADCTGHGVPGALMSIVCYNLINQAVSERKLTQPSHILTYLDQGVRETFKRPGEHHLRDGMDIAFCNIDVRKGEIEFSGANNPVWIARTSVEGKKEIIELKGNKQPIGLFRDVSDTFVSKALQISKGDTLYLFTDGYADQFGGPEGKKFKYKRLKELLFSISDLKMSEQHAIIEKRLEEWKGDYEQVDDILLMGVRI